MPEQLQLPYEEITSVANRDYMRDNFKPGAKVSYVVPFKKILIREGFNQRIVYEGIEELADSIYTHGQQEPFVIDVLPDGRYFLEIGHRRHKAYQLLIQQGRFKATTEVEFFPNRIKDNITEERRMVNQYVTNNLQKPLKPLEQAGVAYSLKHNFGQEKTNEEVAALMTVSRQTIDNLIIIAEADDSVKESIRNGDMSMTNALSFIRSQRKAQKQADKKEEESHISSASASSLPEDPLKKDIEELNELEQQAEEYKAEAAESRERQRMEKLYEIANEVLVNKEALTAQIGKRLAAPACKEWKENFVDLDTGETIPVERKRVVVDTNVLIDEQTIKQLIEGGVQSVFINKHVIAAPSVITEPIATPEKSKYDQSRPEVAQVSNAIGLNDRASVRVEKLDISDQDKKDLTDFLKWQMNDLLELREWVHNNKKQNKRDR